jgi:hypothetical protein
MTTGRKDGTGPMWSLGLLVTVDSSSSSSSSSSSGGVGDCCVHCWCHDNWKEGWDWAYVELRPVGESRRQQQNKQQQQKQTWRRR